MALELDQIKTHDPIVDRVFIPAGKQLRERYARVKLELEARGKRKLHELARERLSSLLDEVERLLHGDAS